MWTVSNLVKSRLSLSENKGKEERKRAGRRTYTEEFKHNALEMLHESGKTWPEVARELGIGAGQLNRWRRALE
jgi:transposase-like protein